MGNTQAYVELGRSVVELPSGGLGGLLDAHLTWVFGRVAHFLEHSQPWRDSCWRSGPPGGISIAWRITVLVRITQLTDNGDERGRSFSLDGLMLSSIGPIRDFYATTLRPGHSRGNHYHLERDELIFVLGEGRWTLRWESDDHAVHAQEIDSGGATLLAVDKGLSHEISNTGERELTIVCLFDRVFDPENPDSYARRLKG